MAFTDLPYDVAYEGKTAARMTIANDALGSDFAAFLRAACAAMIGRTRGAIYVCMSSSEIGALKATFETTGGHRSTFIVWAKNAFTLGRSDYQRQYEPILYGWELYLPGVLTMFDRAVPAATARPMADGLRLSAS